MPNALNAHSAAKRILILGDTGAGKTTQFLTFPGKKYAHLFDPNALLSLRGYDVDYDEYLPSPVRAAVQSLSKDKGGDAGSRKGTSDVYKDFEDTFNQRLKDGFFDQYDWISFDSATTILDLMMDRVLSINGRLGQWPLQDDWGPQMMAFTNLCRTLTAMGKNIFFTGHMQDRKNKVGTVARAPMMTGQLAAKIPLLFTDVFGADSDTDAAGKVNYQLHTVRDREFTVVRTSIKGLEPIEDITIDFTKDPVGQGIGGIIEWERKQIGGS